MIVIRIAALAVGFLALLLTFKAGVVTEKLLKKEPDEKTILRVKYIALALAVAAFAAVFISGR